MGDYIPSKTLFPQGLEKTVEAIHQEGMKAGIWFEIENVGEASQAYRNTEHLLHLDGEVLTTSRRRFWNMADPWVKEYLRERVTGTLKKYGFEYMKIDYNDTIGIGCDGAESPGEGLRRNMMETMDFLKEIKREVPGIILENCASEDTGWSRDSWELPVWLLSQTLMNAWKFPLSLPTFTRRFSPDRARSGR